MKTSLLTNMLLVITTVLLAMILIQQRGADSTVYAQSGAKFGYVQTGTSPALQGAEAIVVDLRNGNMWTCQPGKCKFDGRLPLEQLDGATAR